jgi:hypothetical protein
MLGSGIFGVARALSPNFETFLAFEFLEAAFSGGIYAVVFILGMYAISQNIGVGSTGPAPKSSYKL